MCKWLLEAFQEGKKPLSLILMLTEHQKVKLFMGGCVIPSPSVVERALRSGHGPSWSLQDTPHHHH